MASGYGGYPQSNYPPPPRPGQPPPGPYQYGQAPPQPSYGGGGYPQQQPQPANYYGQPPSMNQQQQQPYPGPMPNQPQSYPPPPQNYGYPPQQPPQQQPGYGQPAMPPYGQPQYPGVDPESQAWFMAVDTAGRGRITMHQLQEALINPSGGRPFDARTCNMLIRMFDKNGDGTIDCQEFCALRNFISQWKMQFDRVDTNRSGCIDPNGFAMAMQNLGHSLSPAFSAQALRTFGTKPHRRTMDFDAFISSCALIHALSRVFAAKQQPPQQQPIGNVTFAFEEYIRIVFEHVLAE